MIYRYQTGVESSEIQRLLNRRNPLVEKDLRFDEFDKSEPKGYGNLRELAGFLMRLDSRVEMLACFLVMK